MGRSKELFMEIREAMLEDEQLQSQEYRNHEILASLRGFHTSSGIRVPNNKKSSLESLKIKNNK